ncbi:MAG: response regulator, partial [Planctomycetes bacterium]|nr:response regulator [Planctomycetota bacterium]
IPGFNAVELSNAIRENARQKDLLLVGCTSDIVDFEHPDYAPFEIISSKPLSAWTFQNILNDVLPVLPNRIEKKPLDGIRLLVVDDNPINRALIRRQFENLGVKIFEAENGKDGLEILKTGRFDAVFIDQMMPVMDGDEAIRCIRSDPRIEDLPVLAFTADDSEETRNLLTEAGADEIVLKPFRLVKIVDQLCRVMAMRKNTRLSGLT